MSKKAAKEALYFLWSAGHEDPQYLMEATKLPQATVYRNLAKFRRDEGV